MKSEEYMLRMCISDIILIQQKGDLHHFQVLSLKFKSHLDYLFVIR